MTANKSVKRRRKVPTLKPRLASLTPQAAAPKPTPRLSYRKRERQRMAVLAEQPLCVKCQAGECSHPKPCYLLADEVDHIVPLAMGGAEDASNLQPLCRDCHAEKTAGEGYGLG